MPGLIPNPWVLVGVGVLLLATNTTTAIATYHFVDNAAQVAALNKELAGVKGALVAANSTIAEQERRAKATVAIADAATLREAAANQKLEELQGQIDDIARTEAAKPPSDGCALDDERIRQLLPLTRAPARAGAAEAGPAGRASDVRPAGPGAAAR